MKKQLTILSLTIAGLCAVPFQIRAADEIPPTPPGGASAPPATGEKIAAKPNAERRGPGGPGGPGARMNPEERLKRMTEELSLTQEQQDKIKAIYEKDGPQLRELMAKGRENLSEADKEKVKELLKTQMEEVTAVLTPEQKEKFRTAMERRRAEREKK
jgi:Spy/CpxP family protein refolding chaperone